MITRLNRIGNVLVPNTNYCAFEDWVVPILDRMLEEQEGPEQTRWSPSSIIHRLGKEIDNEESVYYWCYKVSCCGCDRVAAQLKRNGADEDRIIFPSSALRSQMDL